jgi:hypothetical protein
MWSRKCGQVDGLCPEGGCYDIRSKLLADGGLLIKNGVLGILASGARIFGAVSAYDPIGSKPRHLQLASAVAHIPNATPVDLTVGRLSRQPTLVQRPLMPTDWRFLVRALT